MEYLEFLLPIYRALYSSLASHRQLLLLFELALRLVMKTPAVE